MKVELVVVKFPSGQVIRLKYDRDEGNIIQMCVGKLHVHVTSVTRTHVFVPCSQHAMALSRCPPARGSVASVSHRRGRRAW